MLSMQTTACARYWEIAKSNFRFHFLPHLGLCFLLFLLAPVLFGIQYLDERATANLLEIFLSLSGVILLTPIFAPEQEEGIVDVVEAKYTSSIAVYLIRFLYSFLTLVVLLSGFVFLLRFGQCAVNLRMLAGVIVTAGFLGALGLFSFGMSCNIAVGYMVPLLYYVLNLTGGRYFGRFYLFSMLEGSYVEKCYLAAAGTLLILFTFLIRYLILRRR